MADLDRFIQAHKFYYDTALEEIRNGRKESHWIWYIFPQIKGLGYSSEAQRYAIQGRSEAEEYLADSTLRSRLIEVSNAILECDCTELSDVMGYPDDLKVKSCMTLFKAVCPEEPVFDKVLQKYFNGESDEKTLELLNE